MVKHPTALTSENSTHFRELLLRGLEAYARFVSACNLEAEIRKAEDAARYEVSESERELKEILRQLEAEGYHDLGHLKTALQKEEQNAKSQ